MRNSLLSKPPARGRRGVPRQRPTSESESETKGGGRMSCAHTSQHLLKMLQRPLRSNSASSPSRIHWFTTGHAAKKRFGLSVFCFINRSVSWDPSPALGLSLLWKHLEAQRLHLQTHHIQEKKLANFASPLTRRCFSCHHAHTQHSS